MKNLKNKVKKAAVCFLAFAVAICSSICYVHVAHAAQVQVHYVGASVSFETVKNLRFKFSVSEDNVIVDKITEYGALVANGYDFQGDFTENTEGITKVVAYNSEKEIDYSVSMFDGTAQFAVSLANITEENYDKIFSVRPYWVIDGDVSYGDKVSTTVYNVLGKAVADTDAAYTEAQKADFAEIIKDYTTDSSGNPVNIAYGNDKTAQVQQQTENRISEIRRASSGFTPTYYVSAEGDDNNSGTSADKPWKTLNKVSSAALSNGSVVAFRKGDTFRGQLVMQGGVTYTSYGNAADKPKLYGSPEDGTKGTWTLVSGTNNIYTYSKALPDIGVIVFDSDEYSEKMTLNQGETFSTEALTNDLSFCSAVSDLNSTGTLYLRSDWGNPSDVFTSIEFATRGDVVTGSNTKNVTVDNLTIMYSGSHGVGTTEATNVTVQNCEIAWVGGSVLYYEDSGAPVRYGNGVQVSSACDGFTVKDNYIHDIYDAGITHQQSNNPGAEKTFKDVLYENNVVERCQWSIEYYMDSSNNPSSFPHQMNNVNIKNNILRLAGYGFGSQRQNTTATHIMGWWLTPNKSVGEFNITGNIFDRSSGDLVDISAEKSDYLPTLSGNTYIQNTDGWVGRYGVLGDSYFAYKQTGLNNITSVTLKNNWCDKTAEIILSGYYVDITKAESYVNKIDYFLKESNVQETYTYDIPVRDTVVSKGFKQLKNGWRVLDITVPAISKKSTGNSVNILHISDIHFNTVRTDGTELPSALGMYEKREFNRDNYSNVPNLLEALDFGKCFSKSIITGDIMDYFSYGNMDCVSKYITGRYDNVLLTMGNHDAVEVLSTYNPECTESFTSGQRYDYINKNVYTTNDIYLAKEIIRDDNGNEKAMVVLMDNQSYKYHLTNAQIKQFKGYISEARVKGIPLLIFQHEPLSTGYDDGNGKDIITTFDNRNNPNGNGEDWGINSKYIGGSKNSDSKSREIYDIITSNADFIRGVFTGHVHNNVYTEILAKTAQGKDAVIPQYTICGNYSEVYINSITIE